VPIEGIAMQCLGVEHELPALRRHVTSSAILTLQPNSQGARGLYPRLPSGYTAKARCFLRHLINISAPRPAANNGREAGSGVTYAPAGRVISIE
jgi:hypothetical protein